jgi:DNA polymerase V
LSRRVAPAAAGTERTSAMALPLVSYAARPPSTGDALELPFSLACVPAGFPSPAEDYLENSLDIAKYLVKRPKATFFMRAAGDSMVGAGIHDGDMIVIDRADQVKDGSIVVARLNDEFVVKRFRLIDGRPWLYPANEAYEPIEVTEDTDFEIWGRVTFAITTLR